MRFQSLPPLLLLALSGAGAWSSPLARTPQVTVELIGEISRQTPPGPITAGLRFQPEPGWHIYWSNPGDSGMPPSVRWKLPPGFSAGPLLFPYPERILTPPLVSYGYTQPVILLAEITPPAGWQAAPITLQAEVDWLVCKEACLPGHASLGRTLAFSSTPESQSRWQEARRSLPVGLPANPVVATPRSGFLDLLVSAPTAATPLSFFPETNGWLDDFQPAETKPMGDQLLLRLPLREKASLPDKISGLLLAEKPWDAAGHRALAISVALNAPSQNHRKTAGDAMQETGQAQVLGPFYLPLTFLFAFLGGLILNVMPCVFPILSLKALHLVQLSSESRQAARREGIAFGSGVLLSLLFLAGLMLVLRASGHAIGWGFQLQSPPVVWLLLTLLFALALNLVGLFEFPVLLSSLASKNSGQGWTGAFASGLLAVAVASPCTAPFMGVALASAFALPPAGTLLIFSSMALGFAFPVMFFSFFPSWLSFLPKPGAWMNTFKKILSLPMLLAVGWLVWVLFRISGTTAIWILWIGGVNLAAGLFLYGRGQRAFPPKAELRWGGLALVLLAVVIPAAALKTGTAELVSRHPDRLAWSEEEVTRQLAAGRTVFIDFTAAWCLTCQVNERVVLSKPEIQAAFREKNISFLVADWTRRDPAITAALQKYGREGVPTYVLLRPDGSVPQLLPEILTPKLVLEALR